jgi:hypothetical protein
VRCGSLLNFFVPVSFKVASEPGFGLVVDETITLLVSQGRGDEAHTAPRNFFSALFI